jgi:hypothetical protein
MYRGEERKENYVARNNTANYSSLSFVDVSAPPNPHR